MQKSHVVAEHQLAVPQWFENRHVWWPHVDLASDGFSRAVGLHMRMGGPQTCRVEACHDYSSIGSVHRGSLAPPAHPALRVPASAWCILCSRGRVVAMLELATRLREIVAFCSQCAFGMLQLRPGRSLLSAFGYAPCGVKMFVRRPACECALRASQSRPHSAIHHELCYDAAREV